MRHKTRCVKLRTVDRSFFDRLILQRVEQYAINHDLHDLDAAVNYLRTNYREYRRHKEDFFRTIVLRAIQTLQHNKKHQNRKRNRLHEEEEEEEEEKDDDEEEEASSSGESDSSGSQFELNPTSFPGLMNSVLRTNYGANVNTSSPKSSESTKITQENTTMDINIELCTENVNELDGIVSDSKEKQESRGEFEVKKEDKGLDSRVMFKDLGGLSGVINEVMEIIYPLFHPEIYPWLGVQPMKGILLHGPPGCGKTKLAHAIANEAGVPFYKISATEVVSGVSGTIHVADIV